MKLFFLVLVCMVMVSFISLDHRTEQPLEKLSDYNFFDGELRLLKPNQGVIPYTVNTPLFSNYAEKARFVSFPEGKAAIYNDSTTFDFPEGTYLIKNFYYPLSFKNPEKGRRIIETRLLYLSENGWQAYPYIWNEEQTEAYYDPTGDTRTIEYLDSKSKKVQTPYVIPNKNQCKGCHVRGDQMKPIGLSSRQLNRESQLENFKEIGVLKNLPANELVPKLAVWNDPTTGDLNSRARAYLDSNCGHCHSRSGPASTSGLFLDIHEKDLTRLGVNKTPVAAGRGAGNLKYDIVPGQPSQSILVYRMNTNDPAIAMPELGREQIHKEAIELIEEWIKKKAFEN